MKNSQNSISIEYWRNLSTFPTDELDHGVIDNDKITTRAFLATVYERLVHMLLYHNCAGILEKSIGLGTE